jgi:hypothetical protein
MRIFSRLIGRGQPTQDDWPVIAECVAEGLSDTRQQWLAMILRSLPKTPLVSTLDDEMERRIQFFQCAFAIQRLRIEGYIRSQDDQRTFSGLLAAYVRSAGGEFNPSAAMDFAIPYSEYPHFWTTDHETRGRLMKDLMKNLADALTGYLYGSKDALDESHRAGLAVAIGGLSTDSQVVLALCFRDEKCARNLKKAEADFLGRL